MACERDLNGIVAKWARGKCGANGQATSWLKIKNPDERQMRDRHELFALGAGRWTSTPIGSLRHF